MSVCLNTLVNRRSLLLFSGLFALSSVTLSGCKPGSGKINRISYEQLKSKCDHKKTFVVAIMLEGCEYCEKLEPELERYVQDSNLTIEECVILKKEKDDAKMFLLKSFPKFRYFPSVYYVSNGEPLNKLSFDAETDINDELNEWADAGIFSLID